MIPLTKPYFSDKNIKKISNTIPEILKSGRLMMGKWNEKFEKSFQKILALNIQSQQILVLHQFK